MSDNTELSPKSKSMARILCVLFGWLGVHRFYLGHTLVGVIQLFTCGGFGIWYTIDNLMIVLGKMKDSEGRELS